MNKSYLRSPKQKYRKTECVIVTLDGFCSAPSSSSPPWGRTSRVPVWPQAFPYSLWAYESKTHTQSWPIRSVITPRKPTCDSKPACHSQSA